jgi:3-isopropylmalate dehydrogenase
VALLLRHSLQLEREAVAVEKAVDGALRAGCRTADLQPVQALSTMQMAAAIVQRLPKR